MSHHLRADILNLFSRQIWFTLTLLMSGCSLFFDTATLDQCVTDADCTDRGGEFVSTVCEDRLCVSPSSAGDGDSSGGQGNMPATPECTSNGECIDKNNGSPFLCRDEKCVALTIAGECPIVLGAGQNSENLRKPEPIIFGAYSMVDPTVPRLSAPTLNYELAIDEVNKGTRGGLPGGPGGTLRPFVAVVCSATNNPDLDQSLTHLTQTLKVPAILASLYSADLVTKFQEYGLPSSTFFLSPLEADSTLTNIADDGLLWHMLASSRDLAPAYAPLLEQTERYLRATGVVPESEPLKVAMIEAKNEFLSDLAEGVMKEIRFNNRSAIDNENEKLLLRLRTDSALDVSSPDTSIALLQIQKFRPHVILAVSSSEFIPLLSEIEESWSSQWGAAPFYLVAPYVFGQSALTLSTFANVHRRLLGVNFSGAADSSLYDLYLSRLKSTYDVSFSLEGLENFYDAAYYLMYSIAAAGTPARLSGHEVALGMARLLSGKISFDVGPSDVSDAIGTLLGSKATKIKLVGTMGPPDFNSSTGARNGKPSIYCIHKNQFLQDAMTYNSETSSLSGAPPCVEGFAQ